jgi:hypothetical protein
VQPLLRWKSHKYYIFWVCVCSLTFAACNAHEPYYTDIWPIWLYHITLLHYLINCTIFGKKLLNVKYVFSLSLQLLSETFLILRRIQQDMIKNVLIFSYELSIVLVKFLRYLNFVNGFLKNIQMSNFMKILPVEVKFYEDGRMDRHDEVRLLIL